MPLELINEYNALQYEPYSHFYIEIYICKLYYGCSDTAYIVTVIFTSPSSGISKGALAGIVLGAIAFAVTLSVIVDILILRICLKDYRTPSKRTKGEYLIMNSLVYYFFLSLTCFQCPGSVTNRSLEVTAHNFILTTYSKFNFKTSSFRLALCFHINLLGLFMLP